MYRIIRTKRMVVPFFPDNLGGKGLVWLQSKAVEESSASSRKWADERLRTSSEDERIILYQRLYS